MKIDCRGLFSRRKFPNVFKVMKIGILAVFVLVLSSFRSKKSHPNTPLGRLLPDFENNVKAPRLREKVSTSLSLL